MKGTCYGGVLYLPHHPDSDLNGLIRCVIRTKSWLRCEQAIEYVFNSPAPFKVRALLESHLWKESESSVEQLVSATHYGEILVCPLAACYVSPAKYKTLEKIYYPRNTASLPTEQRPQQTEKHETKLSERYPPAYRP